MPKNECEPDDPHELVGVEVPVDDPVAAAEAQAAVLVEEFVRLGFDETDIVRTFGGSFYAGAHALTQRLGETRMREIARDAIARLRPLASVSPPSPPTAGDSR